MLCVGINTYHEVLRACVCCPRECGVDRLAGELGYCRAGAGYQLGSICLHRGEEPVVSGQHGICNVFFSHCNLQCCYCQNYQISRNSGPEIEYILSLDEVVCRIAEVLDQGAKAVGFVSPSHVIPQVQSIIYALRERGRRPVTVYNTNGYDRVESLAGLESLIDVYLPDLKYMDQVLAAQLSDAPDYPQVAGKAIREMVRQKGLDLVLNAEGEIQSGVIVRHLVLPGQVENSRCVLRFLAEEISPKITISLMAQYNPLPGRCSLPELDRGVTSQEYQEVLDELDFLGLENGWVQELESRECYQPDFAKDHPFETNPRKVQE